MPNRLAARAEVPIGAPAVLDTMSEDRRWYVNFDADDETAWFYAVDCSGEKQVIHGALHVYNVRSRERGAVVTVELVWASDDKAVAVSIDGVPHAAFDFVANRATCLTGSGAGPEFPPPYDWDDAVVAAFYE